MKNSLRIPNKILIIISFFITITILFLFFLFQYKVKSVIEVKVIVKHDLSKSILIDSEVAYKIQYKNQIRLKIGSNYYDSIIGRINYNSEYKKFEVNLINLKKSLIPESVLNAFIIQDVKPVFYFLVGV
ncbi:MAG: hypothetical protein HRT99_02580 [Mycoplasmatales bacterium]|nr:hypothetical protein [Mycoplasmatales bacterium]